MAFHVVEGGRLVGLLGRREQDDQQARFAGLQQGQVGPQCLVVLRDGMERFCGIALS